MDFSKLTVKSQEAVAAVDKQVAAALSMIAQQTTAIAKAVVVAHGGRIWIEEGLRGGCVVAFDIPGEEQLV